MKVRIKAAKGSGLGALVKPGTSTKLEKATTRASKWCDRESKRAAKDDTQRSTLYTWCRRAQAALVMEYQKEGLGVVPVKAWDKLKKRAAKTKRDK